MVETVVPSLPGRVRVSDDALWLKMEVSACNDYSVCVLRELPTQ
jgi:hypothetical protein